MANRDEMIQFEKLTTVWASTRRRMTSQKRGRIIPMQAIVIREYLKFLILSR
jgi:hypothetical protein